MESTYLLIAKYCGGCVARERRTRARRNYAALVVEGLEHGVLETGTFLEWLDPEIDWRGPRQFPDLAEPRVGREGVRDYVRVLFEAIEGHRMVLEELIDAGDDQEFVFSREGGRGREKRRGGHDSADCAPLEDPWG